jgi:hypothetical protein
LVANYEENCQKQKAVIEQLQTENKEIKNSEIQVSRYINQITELKTEIELLNVNKSDLNNEIIKINGLFNYELQVYKNKLAENETNENAKSK